jgi:23S rRNA pseudouridine1911/1915/1917 synthase
MENLQRYNFNKTIAHQLYIKKRDEVGQRLDTILVKKFPDYSRSLFQKLIKDGLILVNHRETKQSYRLKRGDTILVKLPEVIKPQAIPTSIPLDIIYEDEWLVAINKPAGLVVHPSSGHLTDTLINALVARYGGNLPQKRGDIIRPGIVHRIDKDTSGIVIAARTQQALSNLSKQFQSREVEKEYIAIVVGDVKLDSDVIEKSLSRHKKTPLKMAVVKKDVGKVARTYYEVVKRFGRFTLLKVRPITGKMHQIRVHLSAIGHPCAGDSVYGAKSPVMLSDINRNITGERDKIIISHQALHAHRIKVLHPVKKTSLEFIAPLPDDMREFLQILETSTSYQS